MFAKLWKRWQGYVDDVRAEREHLAKLDAIAREERRERLRTAGFIEVPHGQSITGALFEDRIKRVQEAIATGDIDETNRVLREQSAEAAAETQPDDSTIEDMHRVYALGMARGRAEEQATHLEAMLERGQPVEPTPSLISACQTLARAIGCIDKGQIAEAKAMISHVLYALLAPPPSLVRADQWSDDELEDLKLFAQSAGIIVPQFNRTTQAGGIHMYSDREDMVRDALKEMTPADRIKALRAAGVVVTDDDEAFVREPGEVGAWLDYEKTVGRTLEMTLDNERGLLNASGEVIAPLRRRPAFSEAHKAEQERINQERNDMLEHLGSGAIPVPHEAFEALQRIAETRSRGEEVSNNVVDGSRIISSGNARMGWPDHQLYGMPDAQEPLLFGTVCNTKLPHDPPLPEVRIESDVDGQRVSSPIEVTKGDEPGAYRADIPPMQSGDTVHIDGVAELMTAAKEEIYRVTGIKEIRSEKDLRQLTAIEVGCGCIWPESCVHCNPSMPL